MLTKVFTHAGKGDGEQSRRVGTLIIYFNLRSALEAFVAINKFEVRFQLAVERESLLGPFVSRSLFGFNPPPSSIFVFADRR